jgi:predicted GIY-YIG superfamily endonuclease
LNLSAIIGKSAEARERRLVPEVIEEFFIQAAPIAGVNPNEIREGGHVYKLGKVPRSLWPVGERLEPRFGKLGRDYKNIVFDKEHLKRDPTLEWVTPGHPLFEAVREDVSEHVREDLLRGAVFYDLHQAYPYRLDVFAASIKDGRNNQLHRRIFVVEACLPDRQANHSSTMTVRQPTIFLDLALASKDARVPDGTGLPDRDAAERFLVTTALNPFLAEVATQRARETATIEKHLKISLNELIHRQNLRMAEIHESGQFGDETLKAANMKKVEDKLDELNGRLEQRTAELRREAECMIGEIQHVGRAWVLPHPERNSPQIREMVTDPEIERIAVQHAIAHETAQGRVCESVEADNRGFDLISRKFELPGQTPGVFFVYAILCKDNTIYIGQTENLAQRWNEHRTGQGADWTASHGVQYVLHYEQLPSREAAVEMERQWKSGSGRDALKAKTQDRHLPAGRQVDVRFIEVKGRSHTGDIALTTNEYNTARRLRKDYWLYIVFHCASPNPSLNILNDPSTLDWQPIVKVEHYRLKQDSVKHPVELKEDSPPYRTGGEK